MENMKHHLLERRFNTSLHRVWIDEENYIATFPLWNTSGQLVGYQRYNPNGDKKVFNHPLLGKYYTYRSKPEIAVWGLESWHRSDTLFITEGVFDAVKATWLGFSALALLANDQDRNTTRWLWTIRKFRRVVAICDGDKAGIKLAKFGHQNIVLKEGTDFGDTSISDAYDILQKYK